MPIYRLWRKLEPIRILLDSPQGSWSRSQFPLQSTKPELFDSTAWSFLSPHNTVKLQHNGSLQKRDSTTSERCMFDLACDRCLDLSDSVSICYSTSSTPTSWRTDKHSSLFVTVSPLNTLELTTQHSSPKNSRLELKFLNITSHGRLHSSKHRDVSSWPWFLNCRSVLALAFALALASGQIFVNITAECPILLALARNVI